MPRQAVCFAQRAFSAAPRGLRVVRIGRNWDAGRHSARTWACLGGFCLALAIVLAALAVTVWHTWVGSEAALIELLFAVACFRCAVARWRQPGTGSTTVG